MQLGLSKEQIEARKFSIGGSDANTILSGKPDRIIQLWRQKRGLEPAEDLSDVLPVQMGSFTEPFNRYWFTKQTGREVTNFGEERIDFERSFMTTTLDGLTDGGGTLWEAKHVSAFANKEEVLARYMPQLHHNMIVCGLERAVLSVFFGTLEYQFFEVDRDTFYEVELIEAEERFWSCVRSGAAPAEIPAPKPPVKAIRTQDYTGNNLWAALAHDWLTHKSDAVKFDAAARGIKEIVADDVVRAYGHGISVSRNKKGALTIKEDEL